MGCGASAASNVKCQEVHAADAQPHRTLLQQRLLSRSLAASSAPSKRNVTVDDLAVQMHREKTTLDEQSETDNYLTGEVILPGKLCDRTSLLEDAIANEFRAQGVDEWAIPLFVADHTSTRPAIQVEIDAQGVGCIPIPANWNLGDAILIAMPRDEEGGVWKHVITPPTTRGKMPLAKAGEVMRVPMHQLRLFVWCTNANTHIHTRAHLRTSPSSC